MKSLFSFFGLILLLYSCGPKVDETYRRQIAADRMKENEEFLNPVTSPLDSTELLSFKGLRYFPVDEAYKVIAKIERFQNQDTFALAHSHERTKTYRKFGKISFSLKDQNHELILLESAQLIGRSADFIGHTDLSFISELVFKRMAAGKAAQWMLSPDLLHNYTYVKDAGKALAMLATHAESFGQVWHLPSDSNYINGRRLVEISAEVLQVPNKVKPIPKFMLAALGLFIPVIKESMEMLYQLENPYLFSSSKFDAHFGLITTPIEKVIHQTALSYRSISI